MNPPNRNTEKPSACWTGRDYINGETQDTLTVIFRTGGCRWNRCRMCGYRHDRYQSDDPAEVTSGIRKQLNWVKKEHDIENYPVIKIYTSGSILDPGEVPTEILHEIGNTFRGKIVIAETRPEHVTRDMLVPFMETIDYGTHEKPLYIATGLETTNDFIREKSIDKGFTFADFVSAADVAHSCGVGVKAYLLMKPPFLTEKEAIEDMVKSIGEVSQYADIISMNPCTVQSRTEVERLWQRRSYRPPYLWSVLDVLIRADRYVSCDPVGGGHLRGPHNCRQCDREIVSGIRDYSMTNDQALLRALFDIECDCRKEWEYVIENEHPCWMPLTR